MMLGAKRLNGVGLERGELASLSFCLRGFAAMTLRSTRCAVLQEGCKLPLERLGYTIAPALGYQTVDRSRSGDQSPQFFDSFAC